MYQTKLASAWLTLARLGIWGIRRMALITMTCLVLALTACSKPPWRIEKILINPPAPLSGTATVLPLELVAPNSRDVDVQVAITRGDGFNDRIRIYRSIYWYPPDRGRFLTESRYQGEFPSFINQGASRGAAPLVHAQCDGGTDPAVPVTLILSTLNPREEKVRVMHATEARSFIDVVIGTEAGGYEVFGHADRFEIICRRPTECINGTSRNIQCPNGGTRQDLCVGGVWRLGLCE